MLQIFDTYCKLKTNETYERHIFYVRNQMQGETVKQFIMDLKLTAQTCSFGDMCDSMICNRIVGIASQKVRERLLREDDLTLATAIKIWQAAEATQRQITTLGKETRCTTIVHTLDERTCAVQCQTKKTTECNTKGKNQLRTEMW